MAFNFEMAGTRAAVKAAVEAIPTPNQTETDLETYQINLVKSLVGFNGVLNSNSAQAAVVPAFQGEVQVKIHGRVTGSSFVLEVQVQSVQLDASGRVYSLVSLPPDNAITPQQPIE